MTRKDKRKDKAQKTKIRFLEQQPLKFTGAICPINLEEQRERFLKHGKLPQFVLKGSEDEIEQLYHKAKNQIRFDLFGEAEFILKSVKEKYGDAEKYITKQYGERISKEQATEVLQDYIKEHNLDGAMSIIWCNDMAASARMMWVGPNVRSNKPEARNFSFWIRNSTDNVYITEHGIRCLANHEIGTHFFRAFNDGLQPWYSDRRRFGIKGMGSLEHMRAEEGLAAIHTILEAKERFLWGPAMLYYTACKASGMSFKQLFDHLGTYISSKEQRWKYCMRVKRGLVDPNDIGGYGKDQCYFEGAVEILRNIDSIDFGVMMSGKICPDEIPRCKRVARLDCLRVPAFMKNEKKYKKQLQTIANLNGLNQVHPKSSPPAAYIQRLKRGRRIGPASSSGKYKRAVGSCDGKEPDWDYISGYSSSSDKKISCWPLRIICK
ncbi:microtubule-associated tyrosine carboxypeptidase 1-like isoform X3 [Argopecten irradians]|uniref:microtubule-associated tyrosine carboxypeptidase 1-like isoform X3 n=1 Tax=Argopecten irradians TaxID=31199 RepID=UPI003711BD49